MKNKTAKTMAQHTPEEKKTVSLLPPLPCPTYEGWMLGIAISHRFKNMIANEEVEVCRKDKPKMKSELAMTVRRETGNIMCRAEVVNAIDSAVSDYVDGFIDMVETKRHDKNMWLLQSLITRIEDEVWNVKRIAE